MEGIERELRKMEDRVSLSGMVMEGLRKKE